MTENLTRRGAVGALCALAGLGLSTPARAETAEVHIDNFVFTPQAITVKPGTRVLWTNRDDIPHVVVASDAPPLFRSAVLDTDDAYARVFDKPGTYKYFCALHPHMTGVVVVK
jgi:plastocyanin